MGKNVINSVSYPIEMQEFLNDNPDLSISKMLQSKIIEIRERRRLNFNEMELLQKQIKTLQTALWEANAKIDNFEEKEQNVLEKNKQ